MGVLPLTAVAPPVTPMRPPVVMRLYRRPAVPVMPLAAPMRSPMVMRLDRCPAVPVAQPPLSSVVRVMALMRPVPAPLPRLAGR
jgi:hypothetical protein